MEDREIAKIKMYLDIGNLLGIEKMKSLITDKEEARKIWQILSSMDIDTNSTSQGCRSEQECLNAYNLKVELVHFGWKTINTLKQYCHDLYFERL